MFPQITCTPDTAQCAHTKLSFGHRVKRSREKYRLQEVVRARDKNSLAWDASWRGYCLPLIWVSVSPQFQMRLKVHWLLNFETGIYQGHRGVFISVSKGGGGNCNRNELPITAGIQESALSFSSLLRKVTGAAPRTELAVLS